MNLGTMKDELGELMKNRGTLLSWLSNWINAAILEVATDYDLPPLALAEPYSLGVDTSKWLWPLPEIFHKNLFMVKWTDGNGDQHQIRIHKNPAHLIHQNHTKTDDRVHELGVVPQGNSFFLGVHPLANQNLDLWFYQKPAVLVKDADVCDCIPFNFVPQVIYPKVIIKNYQFIVDQVPDFPMSAGALQYWQGELTKGLLGAPGQGIGLLNYFNINYNPPRRTGGRDPVGRSYRRGTI